MTGTGKGVGGPGESRYSVLLRIYGPCPAGSLIPEYLRGAGRHSSAPRFIQTATFHRMMQRGDCGTDRARLLAKTNTTCTFEEIDL